MMNDDCVTQQQQIQMIIMCTISGTHSLLLILRSVILVIVFLCMVL